MKYYFKIIFIFSKKDAEKRTQIKKDTSKKDADKKTQVKGA